MTSGSIPRGAVLYSRPDCPLCFTMKRSAGRIARRLGVPLHVVDITGHAELEALYRNEVPVLVLPGGITFRGRADGAALLSAFEKAARLLRGGSEGNAGRVPNSPSAWDRIRALLRPPRDRAP